MSEESNSEKVLFDDDRTIPGESPEVKNSTFEPGQLVCSRYRVIGELGHGGMGTVFRCLDEVSGLEVALKTLAKELSGSKYEMESVKTNFKLVYNLNHPNIAAYKNLEYDPSSGLYYLIMEYVDGEDLRYYLKNKRANNEFSEALLIDLLAQIASALDYAHEQKVIHRDIKPGNIMVDRSGQIKLLDFGLAAEIHSSLSRVSQYSMDISGTLPYIAPEQWRGKAASAASDQYSFAVMAYETLSGRVPFQANDKDIMRKCVLEETADELTGTTDIINKAIFKAMSKQPEQRFASCSKFVDAMKNKRPVYPKLHIDSNPAVNNVYAGQAAGYAAPEKVQKAVNEKSGKKTGKTSLSVIRWLAFIVVIAIIAVGILTNISEKLEERSEVDKVYKVAAPAPLEAEDADDDIVPNPKAVSEFDKLMERAMMGSPLDQYNLGSAYELGTGTAKNMNQAVFWYNRAAAAGNSDAAFRLGVLYENNKEYYMASQCYQRAAAMGNIAAQNRLNELNKQMMNTPPPVFNNDSYSMF